MMTANELANYVDAREINNPYLKESADMLRQLQAEIQTQYDRGFDDGCKHTKKIYEAEIEALKSELKGWNLAWYEANPPSPVKEQSNIVKVVQDHVKDLKRCVKVFRTQLLNNTANEMEVAIKELEDALESHPVKELTDDDIEIFKVAASYYGIECQSSTGLGEFIKQIVRKAQKK